MACTTTRPYHESVSQKCIKTKNSLDTFFERHRPEIETAEKKVFDVALKALRVSATIALLIYNAGFFAIGFTWAVMSPETASAAVNRIISVWEYNWTSKLLLIGGGIFAAPMGLSLCSLFAGVRVTLFFGRLAGWKNITSLPSHNMHC